MSCPVQTCSPAGYRIMLRSGKACVSGNNSNHLAGMHHALARIADTQAICRHVCHRYNYSSIDR